MKNFIMHAWFPVRGLVSGLLLAVIVGCSNTNLGNIDDTDDPREDMASPGILADEQGESPLTLKTGKSKQKAQPVVASAEGTDGQAVTDEQAEFEQFKRWNHLRNNDPESPEYQEFLDWMEFQKFKAGQ